MTETQHRTDQAHKVQVPAAIEAAPQIVAAQGPVGNLATKETPKLNSAHNEFAGFHQEYVSHYIELSDTKAASAFAISTAALAYIFGGDLQELLLQPAFNAPFVVSISTVLLLVVSASFSFLTIAPRFSTSGEGIVYFGSVANRKSADDYVRDIASKDEAGLIEARLKHSYDISRICVRKYQSLRKAIVAGVPALFGLASMLLLK